MIQKDTPGLKDTQLVLLLEPSGLNLLLKSIHQEIKLRRIFKEAQ